MALRYPINNDDKWEQAFIQFQVITEESGSDPGTGLGGGGPAGVNGVATHGESIQLYLPAGYNIPGSVTYNTADIGVLGAGILSVVERAQNWWRGDETNTAGQTRITEQFGTALTEARWGTIAARVLGNSFGQRELTDFATQTAVNPNTKVLFERVNIRDFNFNFTMIPTSREEANEINRIIKEFRRALYPTTELDRTWLYRFPDKFNIIINTNETGINGEHRASANNLIKFKPAFLTDVNVTYNPNASAWHADGNPLETNLTLSFKESETLVREDIEEGF